MEKTVRGYAVQGLYLIPGGISTTFITGLERTEAQARKTMLKMYSHFDYSEEEKESFKVVRVSEVIEPVD